MADRSVIRVESLGKKYLVRHAADRGRNVTFGEVLARGPLAAWRRTIDWWRGGGPISGNLTEDFWALRDVNFEVTRGEVLGIIGRNGAGKSTLLKILSRITEPTHGRITIRGRVASLVDV